MSEIEALRKQVAALQARVAMLEARSPETDCYSRVPMPTNHTPWRVPDVTNHGGGSGG